MRVDHHMDPIYRHTKFNSENFNWMARLSGVFWSHEPLAGRHCAFPRRGPRRGLLQRGGNTVKRCYLAGC